jgi:6-phosphogluconolactonase
MPAPLTVLPDADALARAGAELFVRDARDAVAARGRFTVALSGGSTPKKLYALLADEPALRDAVPWDKVHLFWGDERYVPADHPDSNFRMTREAMLDKLAMPAANVHRIATEQPPAEAAAAYERHLRDFFGLADGQFPRFDLVYLGMGPDGHTASLFPGTWAVRETKAIVAWPWVDKFSTYRITLTPPAINAAARVAFLIGGKDKTERLREVREGPHEPDRLPSQTVRPTSGELVWLVDRAAAGE